MKTNGLAILISIPNAENLETWKRPEDVADDLLTANSEYDIPYNGKIELAYWIKIPTTEELQ